MFEGETYRYFCRWYNTTWLNERAVETPVVWKLVNKQEGKNILEIGNVLSHYFPVKHDIVDKYENAKGVINQDVVEFQPNRKYDLIVSISTLEHVGWDEKPRDPTKILKAFERLQALLSQKGRMIVTLPIGFNSDLDNLLKFNKIRFTRQFCFRRISKSNIWREVKWGDLRTLKNEEPFHQANGLVIGILEK